MSYGLRANNPASCTEGSGSIWCGPQTDCSVMWQYALNPACWSQSLEYWKAAGGLAPPPPPAPSGPVLTTPPASGEDAQATVDDLLKRQMEQWQQQQRDYFASQGGGGSPDGSGSGIPTWLWVVLGVGFFAVFLMPPKYGRR